jgi:maltose alpha-D-glucosyltransferase/alpha-amylase
VPGLDAALLLIDIHYGEGPEETYFLPLVRLSAPAAQASLERFPQAGVATCRGAGGALLDGTVDEELCQWLLQVVGQELRLPFAAGTLVGTAGMSFASLRGDTDTPLVAERSSAEQSNTSVRFGERIIMKVFRRLEPGPNPDCEVTQFLSDERHNLHVPTFVGSLCYTPSAGECTTLGMFQNLIDNQGDGWTWTLEELGRYYEHQATQTFNQSLRPLLRRPTLSSLGDILSSEAVDVVGLHTKAAATLARRTAELHLDLAAGAEGSPFGTGQMSRADLVSLSISLGEHARQVLDALKVAIARFPDEVVEHAALVLGRRREIAERFRAIQDLDVLPKVSRIHGDYHLGQVLRVMDDFVILDFEGEPARPLAERRGASSPLKDVAGMLRSFSYAAQAGYQTFVARHPRDASPLEPWARLWENCVSAAFLAAYREAVADTELIPSGNAGLGLLLDAFLLDKALYELNYELNHRPAWTRIPLLGILALCREPPS